MNIVVVGANGPTGRLLTKQAVASGYTVTAVTRHPEAFPFYHEQVQVIRGDVFDLSDVERAVAGQDAVLSTIGVPYSFKPITLYSQGTAHLVQAMTRSGVRRLVCVSASATEPHETGGGFLLDNILQPLIITTLGRTMYADMKRTETCVGNSHLDWTVVRSSGLFERESVTAYQMAEDHNADSLPRAQTWRTAWSTNSSLTNTCRRLWQWPRLRARPTSLSFLRIDV